MKRLLLEQTLTDLGCKFHRHGGNHDIWSYENGRKFPFARHPDINDRTARSMIKKAEENRGE
ncbi:type II toxin-antitoxin system HicA family toxin [uncultured Dysgonomonas sp.]|uniref:type II toxin-antitoxin system HicA family toxin n=1 Tax=uncultured Dysgonomonas sp. TaxID=206096 RepID=UPI00261622A7|nr:type II toxin-antitoxin system HicA family toxin [uncultured Dysgonomonas sp.]